MGPFWVNVEKLAVDGNINGIINALLHYDWGTRRDAARKLGQLRELSALERLIECLTDCNFQVRWQSAWALGEIGDFGAVKPLIATLEDKNLQVRSCAIEALGKIGDPLAVDSLTVLLNNRKKVLREEAVIALGQIGGKEALDALKRAKADGKKDVRKKAAEILEGQSADRVVGPVKKLLGNEIKDVQEIPARDLEKIESTETLDAAASAGGDVAQIETSKIHDLLSRLSKIEIGTSEKELINLIGEPSTVMTIGDMLSEFSGGVFLSPPPELNQANWLFERFGLTFQTVMANGAVIDMIGIDDAISELENQIDEIEG